MSEIFGGDFVNFLDLGARNIEFFKNHSKREIS
jgi:hypothetical protein